MRIIIKGKMSDGSEAPQDLINRTGWVIKDNSIAIIDNGEIIPLQIGSTILICNIGGIMTEVELEVTN